MIDRLNRLEYKLDMLFKKVNTLEKMIDGELLKNNRDDVWEEFIRVVKVQERHQRKTSF